MSHDPVDVIALTRDLVAIPSITGDEAAVARWVAQWLTARRWRVTLQDVADGRFNVWATPGDGAPSAASDGGVTMSTHLDTVPPYIAPRLTDGRLWGRGACDAKGIAAAMLTAADRLVASGERRVGLLFVVGEERGSDGAIAANHLPTRSRYLINGEPTESRLASGAKGSLRVLVRTSGREAHSAYPALGRSAIVALLDLLVRLPSLSWPTDPVLGETTVNIGLIRGGTAPNVIPGAAEADLLVRVVSDVRAVQRVLDAWGAGTAHIEYGAYVPAQHLHTIADFAADVVA